MDRKRGVASGHKHCRNRLQMPNKGSEQSKNRNERCTRPNSTLNAVAGVSKDGILRCRPFVHPNLVDENQALREFSDYQPVQGSPRSQKISFVDETTYVGDVS